LHLVGRNDSPSITVSSSKSFRAYSMELIEPVIATIE
jgi:hypothetical protein